MGFLPGFGEGSGRWWVIPGILVALGFCREVRPDREKVIPERFIVDPPTMENLGFRWFIRGDDNRNAAVSVSYRKTGAADWKEALPMLRVKGEVANQDYEPYRCGNLFAGSVLFLDAATEYEVRFHMTDPDGGAPPPRSVTVATRGEPEVFRGGRQLHVFPGDFQGKRPKGSFSGLLAAYGNAKPGDILLLHKGIYRGPFSLVKSGAPGRPIVFRGGIDGEAVLEGPDRKTNLLNIERGDHLMFENLTLRRARIAISAGRKGRPGASGLVVRRCRVEDVISGIWSTSENSRGWLITDNVITGINPTWYPRPQKTYMEPSHTGVNVYGQGHIVCHNRISRFSDSLAIANFGPPVDDPLKHCVSIDFYNNDLSWAQDDTFEADYGCHNIRAYRNRCYNAHTGLSVQPSYGGPIYLIRNELFGITALSLKLHNYCTGLEIYNNTCVVARQGFQSFHMWQNGILRNNLFLGGQRYAMETGSLSPHTTLDYNGYRQNEPGRFLKWFDGRKWGRYLTLEDFRRGTGHEKHGRKVDYEIFMRASAPVQGKTSRPEDFDLRLRPGSPAVDAGCVLPGVTEGFTGMAPDLGCHELGRPAPHHGPR